MAEEGTAWNYAGLGMLFAFGVAGLARFKSAQGGLSNNSQSVTYVGDGTTSKIISLNFRPLLVYVINTDLSGNLSTGDFWITDKSQTFCGVYEGVVFFRNVAATDTADFPFLPTGFDVGKGFHLLGSPNDNESGTNYLLIAFG